jgi:hypothetical protein
VELDNGLQMQWTIKESFIRIEEFY